MQFTIEREELIEPLQAISGAVERRQTFPILSHLLVGVTALEGEEDEYRLTLIGTDMEVEIKAEISLSSDLGTIEEGIITVPARKFLDLTKSVNEGATIRFSHSGKNVSVTSGKSRFSLIPLLADEFPRVDDIESPQLISELTQGMLKSLLQKSYFSMANQDVRYYLNGLLMEIDEGEIHLVATDGHRLAYAARKLNVDYGDKRQIILPRKSVVELIRMLSDCDRSVVIAVGENHAQFQIDDLTLTTKLIDGRYPDYNRVIPSEGNRILTTNRDAFIDAISRVSILSNEKFRGIRMAMASEGVQIHANNPEQEEADEEINADYSGEAMVIGFNSLYMKEALSVIDQDEVTINFIDEKSSSLIYTEEGAESCRYVIMPMRI